jgi:hypothetical protein
MVGILQADGQHQKKKRVCRRTRLVNNPNTQPKKKNQAQSFEQSRNHGKINSFATYSGVCSA